MSILTASPVSDAGHKSRKYRNLERIYPIRESNDDFTRTAHVNGCDLHESKTSFVLRIESIRSKLSNGSAYVTEVTDAGPCRSNIAGG